MSARQDINYIAQHHLQNNVALVLAFFVYGPIIISQLVILSTTRTERNECTTTANLNAWTWLAISCACQYGLQLIVSTYSVWINQRYLLRNGRIRTAPAINSRFSQFYHLFSLVWMIFGFVVGTRIDNDNCPDSVRSMVLASAVLNLLGGCATVVVVICCFPCAALIANCLPGPRGSRPLRPEEVPHALTDVEYVRPEGDEEGDQCVVCMVEYEPGEMIAMLRGCKHRYHRKCVEPWLVQHNTCPLCRAVVMPADMVDVNV